MPGQPFAGIRVEGSREVRRALKGLGADVHDMTDLHRSIAQSVLPLVQSRVRHGKTGKLAGSFRVRASTAKAAIGSGLVYAPVQEFGWPRHGIAPSRAVVNAVVGAQASIAAQYQTGVGKLVAKAQAGG